MTIFDEIRELIKAAEMQIEEFSRYKTGDAEKDVKHEMLMKNFNEWLLTIQYDIADGKTEKNISVEEYAKGRLESLIKVVNLVISFAIIDGKKLNEIDFIKYFKMVIPY